MAYLGQNLQVMPFEPLAFLLCHKAYFHGKIWEALVYERVWRHLCHTAQSHWVSLSLLSFLLLDPVNLSSLSSFQTWFSSCISCLGHWSTFHSLMQERSQGVILTLSHFTCAFCDPYCLLESMLPPALHRECLLCQLHLSLRCHSALLWLQIT
jgi:hypothetical protein